MAIAVVSFTACKKNEVTLDSDTSSKSVIDIKVENGMLVFRDTAIFKQYFNRLLANENLNLNVADFTSYLTLYENIQEEYSSVTNATQLNSFLLKFRDKIIFNPDSSISPVYINPLIHSFINVDGKFMIGNQLQLYTKDAYIQIDNPDQSKLISALSKTNNDKTSNGIKVFGYVGKKEDQSIPTVSAAQVTGRINETIHYNNDHNRRLFIQTYNEIVSGSSGEKQLYIRLYQEKKGVFGSWSLNNTDIYLNDLSYNVSVDIGSPIPSRYSLVSYPGGNMYNYQNFAWGNVSTVYYDLVLYQSPYSNPIYRYQNLYSINLSGSFTSGGVPSAPTTIFGLYE